MDLSDGPNPPPIHLELGTLNQAVFLQERISEQFQVFAVKVTWKVSSLFGKFCLFILAAYS